MLLNYLILQKIIFKVLRDFEKKILHYHYIIKVDGCKIKMKLDKQNDPMDDNDDELDLFDSDEENGSANEIL